MHFEKVYHLKVDIEYRTLASIYWVLFNTSAPPARIDEAIESMLPDQFEILLYKKNSEYKSWRHSENNFVWRTCPQTDLLVLSVMDGISATSVSCTHIIQWVGQLDSLEISKFQFVSIGNSCVSQNSNWYYIERNYAETYTYKIQNFLICTFQNAFLFCSL